MKNTEEKSINRRDFLKLGALGTVASLASTEKVFASGKDSSGGVSSNLKPPIQKYSVKKYDHLLGGVLKGFSDNQLKAHFSLYEKYISNINDIEMKIKSFDPNSTDTVAYRGLHVEQSFNLNGSVLHELYFGNLSGVNKEPKGLLKKMIERDYGSSANLINHLKGVGRIMRGWAMAGLNYRTGRIGVYGLDQHNQLLPALTFPILVLDVYEHAYMIDYGTDKKKYLEAFIGNINWKVVQERLELALSMPYGEHITL